MEKSKKGAQNGKRSNQKPLVDNPLDRDGSPGSTGKEVEQVMDIKRDSKYYLRSDSSCCWIEEEYEYTNKNTGKTTKVIKNISGFYPNFRMLAEVGLPSHLVRSTEGKSSAVKQSGQLFGITERLKPFCLNTEPKIGRNVKEEWNSLFECSVCGWECGDTYMCDTATFNYCPNCGAKMERRVDEHTDKRD